MPFLLLLVLALVSLQRRWARPAWTDAPASAVLTWGVVVLLVGAAFVLARWLTGQLHRSPAERAAVLRRYNTYRRYHFFALLGGYLGALVLFGWGWTAHALLAYDDTTLPGVELLMLAPLLAGLVLGWAAFYNVECAGRAALAPAEDSAVPGRWAFVALQARHNLLLIAPPLVLMIVQQAVLLAFPALQHDEFLLPLFGAVLLAAVFIGIPWLLRVFLGLRPLPAGPLRDRLLATARRLQFRFTDILVWDTRDTVANAMVTGPSRWLRYVVLTDRLMHEMTPEEVEAVFGHEVGHIKHHHMLFYLGFLAASLMVVITLWHASGKVLQLTPVQDFLADNLPGVVEWLGVHEMVALLPLLLLLGAYLFVVFGFVARRCERQADIFGCRTVSVAVFVEALEKVARLNGISRDRPGWLSSWQHSTIALRVEFLERLDADPGLEPLFQRHVGVVKWCMMLSLGAALGMLVWALGTQEVLEMLNKQ